MSYRLDPSEGVLAGLHRVAREQMESALEELDDPDRAEAAHAYRRRVKKARALLRLVRPALGERYAEETARLRAGAHALAPARDASAVLEAFDALLEPLEPRKDDAPRARLALVRDELEARRARALRADALTHALDHARRSARAHAEAAARFTLSEHGFDALAGGWKRVHRDARQALERARRTRAAEDLHRLRRRAKDQRYQTRLLRGTWKPLLGVRVDELHRLSDLLGADHDLAGLRALLLAEPESFGGELTLHPLLALLDTRRAALQERALPLATRLFAERPRAITRRLRAYWSARAAEELLDRAHETE